MRKNLQRKNGRIFQFTLLLALFAAAIFFQGCVSGGGGFSSSGPAPAVTVTPTATIAGYLYDEAVQSPVSYAGLASSRAVTVVAENRQYTVMTDTAGFFKADIQLDSALSPVIIKFQKTDSTMISGEYMVEKGGVYYLSVTIEGGVKLKINGDKLYSFAKVEHSDTLKIEFKKILDERRKTAASVTMLKGRVVVTAAHVNDKAASAGVVTTAETPALPIAGVSVKLSAGGAALTDSNGFFSLACDLKAGSYSLAFKKTGYPDRTIGFTVEDKDYTAGVLDFFAEMESGLKSLSLSKTTDYTVENTTYDLRGVKTAAVYSDGTTLEVSVLWTASEGVIAGSIFTPPAGKKGIFVLTAKYSEGTKTQTALLTISVNALLTYLALSETSRTVQANAAFDLRAIRAAASYSDGATREVSVSSWSADRGSVSGFIYTPPAGYLGDVNFTASYKEGAVTKTAAFTLKLSRVVKTLALSRLTDEISVGSVYKLAELTATVSYSDKTSRVVTPAWSYNGTALENQLAYLAPASPQKIMLAASYSEDGNAVSAGFELTVRPEITGLSSYSGVAGELIAVTGKGFGAPRGDGQIIFNQKYASDIDIQSWTDGVITVKVPSGSTPGDLIVIAGQIRSNAVKFDTSYINSISPSYGTAGTQVAVSGSGFGASQGTNKLKFNGVEASDIISWSNAKIVARVPAAAANGEVYVELNGLRTNSVNFGLTSIISISPQIIKAGDVVTITGTGFGVTQESGAVRFGAVSVPAANIRKWSDTTIEVQAPQGIVSGYLSVTAGGVASNQFKYDMSSISALNPSFGLHGDLIEIIGAGFGASQSGASVSFNGVSAPEINSWSNAAIKVKVPAGALTGKIGVRIGSAEYLSAANFEITSITSVSPQYGPAGTSVTINGAGFGASQGTRALKLGAAGVSEIVSWSNNKIIAKVPAAAISGAFKIFSGALESAGVNFSVTNITSISPLRGIIGAVVTINGSSFGSTAGLVQFGGVAASEIISWTDTKIMAKVPAGAVSGSISVTAGSLVHNGFNFEVVNVLNVSPAAGTYADEITVSGSGFGAAPASGSVVKIGSIAVTDIKSWSDSEIKFGVPDKAVSAKLSVTVNGITSNGVDFKVLAITSLSQDYGPAGMPVTIKGTGFGASPTAANKLQFNGSDVAESNLLKWTDTEIIAKVPAGAPGDGTLAIVSDGVSSNIKAFAATFINSVNPVQSTAGTQLVINGVGFGPAPGSNGVVFNSASAASIVSWVGDKIIVSVPSGSVSGSVEVVISGVKSNSKIVSIISINSLSASRAAVNTQIAVNGTGFGGIQGTSRIYINNVEAPVAGGLWTDAQVRITVPETAASGFIKAVIGGFETNSMPFEVVRFDPAAPLTPAYGPSGTLVTIGGSGFGTVKGTVAFNGVSASLINEWKDGKIVVTAPSGAISGAVTVKAGVVDLASPLAAFKLSKVTGITPASGPVGSKIYITGEGFGTVSTGNSVKFTGALPCSALSWTDKTIEVTIPQGAQSGSVKLNLWGADTNAFNFTVTNIISVSPSYGPVGTAVTINGTGFGAAAGAVKFGAVTAAVGDGAWSDTMIVTTVPDTAVSGTISVSVSGIENAWPAFMVTKISSAEPSYGPAGKIVTIRGEGFGPSRGANLVYFNGLAASDYSMWSDGVIMVKVPAGASSGIIKLKIGNFYSNDVNFKVSAISSLVPDHGPALTQLDINGSAFGVSQGAGRVFYGGVSLAASDIVSWSDSKISVKVPAAAESGTISVEVNGALTNTFNFSVTKIDSIDKQKCVAGGVLKIFGNGFGHTKGSSKVLFDGLNSSVVEASVNQGVWSMNTVEVIVPYGAVSGNIRFEVGGINSAAYPYKVLAISSMTPYSGTVGREVTISGSGFGDFQAAGDVVRFNGIGVDAGDYIEWSDKIIRVRVPSNATSGGVTVTSGGIESNGFLFNVVKITSISPESFTAGTDVTVNGSGFGTNSSAAAVYFNDIKAVTISSIVDSSLVVKAPAGIIKGSLKVVVNGVSSNEKAYKLLKINSITPTFAARGATVVISGEGFGSAQGASRIKIENNDLLASGWKDDEISATIPAGAVSGNISAVVGGVESNKIWFEVDLNYNYSSQFGAFGTGDANFSSPSDITMDSAGNIWVADANNHRVKKYNSAGVLTGWIGKGNLTSGWHNTGTGETSQPGSGNSEFDTVTGVAVDSLNNIYVVDSGNKKVKKFNSAGGYVKTFETDALVISTYNSPNKLAVDVDNKVYVSDGATNKILRFTSDGSFEVEFGGAGSGNGQFSGISGIAVSADKKIYAADTNNHRVQVLDASGAFVKAWGSFGSGDSQFNSPVGIALDSASSVYVADTGNNRVQKFNAAGTHISNTGSSGAGDGQFNKPSAVAVTALRDTFFVTDKNNNRVQKFVREP